MININDRNGKKQVSFYWTHPITGERDRFRKNAPASCTTKRKAHQWAMAQLERLEDPDTYKPSAMTFREFAVKYLEHAPSFLKPSTVKMRTYRIEANLVPFFGDMRLDEIRGLQVDVYLAARMEDGIKSTTLRGEIAVLSSMLGQAVRWDLLEQKPKLRRPKVEEPEHTYLTRDEADRFIEAASKEPVLENLVPFVLNTGLRTSEVLALRWGHVDMRKRVMTIKVAHVDGITGTTKSGKARTIQLNAIALDALKSQRSRSYMRGGLVFCGEEGEQLDKQDLRAPWARALKSSGVRHFTRHDLRHTFASWLVQSGVQLQVVMELLGHADLQTTMIYAHLSPQNKRSAVAALESFGNDLGTKQKSG